MKKLILIFAVVAFIASSCSQYTCPTYAQVDTADTEQSEELDS